MLSCSIWFSAPSFWMGVGLESRCVGRVYGANGAVRLASRTAFSFSSLHSLQVLHCTLGRPKIQYASVALNSITSSDACQL